MAEGTAITNKHWIRGLDSLRFVLALIVLLSHINSPVVKFLKISPSHIAKSSAIALNHMVYGVAAVIGFFVISGFIIHYPHRHLQQLDVKSFLVRRLTRILLPLLVIGFIAAYFGRFKQIPMWSLYSELIYYLLYPLLFRSKAGWQKLLIGSYILSFLIIFFFNLHIFVHDPPGQVSHMTGNWWYLAVLLMSFVYLPAWLLGVRLANKIDTITTKVTTPQLWLYRLCTLAGSMVILALKAHVNTGLKYLLVVYAILLYKWLQHEIIYFRTHKPSAVLEYLGRFSYSLYLCHKLGFTLVSLLVVCNIYTYPLFIALPILLSYIYYLLVEYPSHKLARWLGGRNKPV